MGKRSIAIALAGIIALSGCAAQEPNPVETASPEASDSEIGKTQPSPYAPELSPKFDQPWPLEVTRVELASSALYKSFEFLDSLGSKDCDIESSTYAGPPLLDEHKPLLVDLTNRMTNTFCDYLTSEFHVIGGNYDFVEETFEVNDIPGEFFRGCQRPANEFSSACAYDKVAWIGISLGSKKRGEVFLEDRRLTIAAHEIFHIVHDQMDPAPGGQIPGPGQENYRPVWFIEGGGEFFGRLMPYYFEMIDFYGTFVPSDRSGAFLDKNYLGDLEKMEIRQNAAFGVENYYSGQVALEYIIASIGMDSLIDIWLEMGKGKDFNQAFFDSTGLKTQEFYEKFKTMHGNLYTGELATN